VFWEGRVDEGSEEGFLVEGTSGGGLASVVTVGVGAHEVEDVENLQLFFERFSGRGVVGVVGLGADAGKEGAHDAGFTSSRGV